MILTTEEAAAVLHTANVIGGFIYVHVGYREVTFYEYGTVAVFDGETGDTERFDDKTVFAARYGVKS